MQRWTTFDRHYHGLTRAYFLAPPGQEWFKHGGNDIAGLSATGLTEPRKEIPGKTRTDLYFEMYGMPGLGVLLI